MLPVDGAAPPTYTQLLGALGEPPRVEVRAERLEPKPRPSGSVRSGSSGLLRELVVKGGELELTYPALGLVATIDREDRPQADPPLRWLRLSAPAATAGSAGTAGSPIALRTTLGLFIGQPREEALALASRAFHARQSTPNSPNVTFVAEAGQWLAWMRPAGHAADDALRPAPHIEPSVTMAASPAAGTVHQTRCRPLIQDPAVDRLHPHASA